VNVPVASSYSSSYGASRRSFGGAVTTGECGRPGELSRAIDAVEERAVADAPARCLEAGAENIDRYDVVVALRQDPDVLQRPLPKIHVAEIRSHDVQHAR
jgi:hypothetical protein